jgi:hypothetical protein
MAREVKAADEFSSADNSKISKGTWQRFIVADA